MTLRTLLEGSIVAAVLVSLASVAPAGPGGCGCRQGVRCAESAGCCGGAACRQMARGPGGRRDAAWEADHDTFLFLIDQRDRIRREVKDLPDGVETVTESSDRDVAERIRVHVHAMYARMKEDRPIHVRDPLFAELFRHAAAVATTIEPTTDGVRVRATSKDPYVVKLIKAHAGVVGRFISEGHPEMRRNHDVPAR
jgi:hypothetical protein